MEIIQAVNDLYATAGVISLMVSALGLWLGKIWVDGTLNRMQADLNATNQRLNAELEKGLHIHRIQFEKEFKIYEEVWVRLVEVRGAALSLRPMGDYINPNQTEGERKKERLTRFGDAIEKFVNVTDKNRPFYSEAVFQSLDKLWKLMHSEAIGYKFGEMDEDNYWETAQKNQELIVAAIEECCLQIRERVGSIKVSA